MIAYQLGSSMILQLHFFFFILNCMFFFFSFPPGINDWNGKNWPEKKNGEKKLLHHRLLMMNFFFNFIFVVVFLVLFFFVFFPPSSLSSSSLLLHIILIQMQFILAINLCQHSVHHLFSIEMNIIFCCCFCCLWPVWIEFYFICLWFNDEMKYR